MAPIMRALPILMVCALLLSSMACGPGIAPDPAAEAEIPAELLLLAQGLLPRDDLAELHLSGLDEDGHEMASLATMLVGPQTWETWDPSQELRFVVPHGVHELRLRLLVDGQEPAVVDAPLQNPTSDQRGERRPDALLIFVSVSRWHFVDDTRSDLDFREVETVRIHSAPARFVPAHLPGIGEGTTTASVFNPFDTPIVPFAQVERWTPDGRLEAPPPPADERPDGTIAAPCVSASWPLEPGETRRIEDPCFDEDRLDEPGAAVDQHMLTVRYEHVGTGFRSKDCDRPENPFLHQPPCIKVDDRYRTSVGLPIP